MRRRTRWVALASTLALGVGVAVAPSQSASAHTPKPKPGKYHGKAVSLEASVAGVPWKPAPIKPPAAPAKLLLTATSFPAPALAQVTLPTAAQVSRSLAAATDAGAAQAGSVLAAGTPVSVAVSSHAAGTAAGVSGFLVSLSRSDGQTSAAAVNVAVDYSTFAQAFGGDLPDRLRLVAMPPCAVTTPKVAACRVQTPVVFTNDPAGKKLSADITLPATTTTTTTTTATATATATTTATTTAPNTASAKSSGKTSAPAAAAPAMVLATTTAPSGSTGTFTATSLSASNQWGIGGNTGSFTYSYPITVPPALGGVAPTVALSYDSGSVDGKTAIENSQPSWIGDGWDYNPGYLERSYVPCTKAKPAAYSTSNDNCFARDAGGNLLPALSLSFGAHGGQLVPTDSTNTSFRLPTDDGTKIDVLQGQINNGTRTGEFYRVTSPDGTVAFFGADIEPDASAMTAAPGATVPGTSGQTTGSTLLEPVFNDTAASGCQDPTKVTDPQKAPTYCLQAWRWNLDFVIDPHGNVTRYLYNSSPNYYGRGTAHTPTWYQRDSVLQEIDYGWQVADVETTNTSGAQHQPAARVMFNDVNRCVDPSIDDAYDPSGSYGSGTSGCSTLGVLAVPTGQMVDTPMDQYCPSGGTANGQCQSPAPTFWSTMRLAGITTQVAVGGTYKNVDHWDLFNQFHQLDVANSPMWLAAIRRCAASAVQSNGVCPQAKNGVANQPSLPDVQFGAQAMAQRVPGVTGTNVPAGLPAYDRERIHSIFNELGATTVVSYDDPTANGTTGVSNYAPLGCTAPPTVAPDWHNTQLCFPEYWTGGNYSQPFTDWFQKYVVTSITTTDNTWQPNAWNSGAHATMTNYTYGSSTSSIYNAVANSNGAGVAWHSNDSELISDASGRTYDQYRGFAVVTTTVGDATEPGHPQTQGITTYLRGMDQDPDKAAAAAGSCTSGTLTVLKDCTPFSFKDDVSGVSTVDDNALAGTAIETQQIDTGDGQVFSTTASVPWKSTPIAAHQRYPATLPYLRSRELGLAQSFKQDTLSTGKTQVTQTRYWHDTQYAGQVVATDTLAPTIADGTSEVCSVTTFAKPDPSKPWMIGYSNSTTTTAGPCLYGTPAYSDPLPATQATGPVLSATRTFFDNGTAFPTTVVAGDATRTESQTGTSAAPGPFQMQTTALFDSYGRMQWSTDAAGTKTSTSYAPTNPSAASMELPVTVTVAAPDPNTGAGTWVSSTTMDPTRGLPLTKTDVNGRVTAITYDALGRTSAVWQPGRTTSTAYPPPSTVAPNIKYSYTTNGYVSGSNSGAAPSVVETDTLREDGTYGVATSLVDSLGRVRQTQTVPASDDAGRVITDTTYDSAGRTDYVSGPYYDSSSSPSGSYWTVTAQTAIPRQTQTQYDGLGRTTAQITIGSGNELWRTTTAYAGADRTDVTPPSGSARTSTVTNSRGKTTSLYTYHSGVAFGTVDFNDADTVNYGYDAIGDLAEVDQVADAAGDANKWTYGYDLLRRKVTSHDPDTGTTNSTYDDVHDGNLQTTTTAVGTQDQKSLYYTYDLLNRRTAEYAGTAATGTPLAQWQFDSVPALSVSQSLANPGSDTRLNLGRPAGSTRNTDAADHYTEAVGGYDAAGNPLSTSVTIPTDGTNGALAGTYTTTNHYTALGQLSSTDLPMGGDLQADTVGFGYDVNGLMIGSTDSYADLISDSSYTPYGEIMRRVLGDYPNQVVQDTAYDVPTRRVFSSTLSQLAWNAPIDTTAYTYDPAGLITAAVDVQATAGTAAAGSIVPTTLAIDAQCYHYDYADRLDAAWSDTVPNNSVSQISTTVTNTVFGTTTTPGTGGQSTVTQIPASSQPTTGALGACTRVAPTQNPPVTATWQIGGPQPYAQVFTYDQATGNRQQEQDYNTAGTVTETSNYSYNAPGANQPHVLNSVSHSTSSTPDTYMYDGSGNTKQRAIAGSPTQTLSWDAENRLQSDSGGSGVAAGYVYDADGNQLLRRDAGTITLYIAGTELHMDRTTQAITGMRYFTAAGSPTITETGGSAPTIGYEAGNSQNTASLSIAASPADPSQAVTARRAYTPFGTARGTGQAGVFGSFADDHTFLGKTSDASTGLVDVGARKYDPTTGRFISADPMFQPASPRAADGYSYAGNDPVSSSDPTGLCPSDICGGGGIKPGGGMQQVDPDYEDNHAPCTPLIPGCDGYVPPPTKSTIGCVDGADCSNEGAFQNDAKDDYKSKPKTAADDQTMKDARWVDHLFDLADMPHAHDFLQHYLDGSGTPLKFDSTDAYYDDTDFHAQVNAMVSGLMADAKTNHANTFDSGYAHVEFKEGKLTDWQNAIGRGYWRVTGTMNADGGATVTLQVTSLYQFRQGNNFNYSDLGINVNGAAYRHLEQAGMAKNFREEGTGTIQFTEQGLDEAVAKYLRGP